MLLLAHMGIGRKLVSPWTRTLPVWPLLLGTILPDLIDKPLFYATKFLTAASSSELAFFSGTRTLGHTAFALLIITLFAMTSRSRMLAALSLGIATHLLLDNLSDGLIQHFYLGTSTGERSSLVALLWPFYKPYFSVAPFNDLGGHLHRVSNPITLGSEVVGALILGWDAWKSRHESEIFKQLQMRRLRSRQLKRLHKSSKR